MRKDHRTNEQLYQWLSLTISSLRSVFVGIVTWGEIIWQMNNSTWLCSTISPLWSVFVGLVAWAEITWQMNNCAWLFNYCLTSMCICWNRCVRRDHMTNEQFDASAPELWRVDATEMCACWAYCAHFVWFRLAMPWLLWPPWPTEKIHELQFVWYSS